MRTTTNEILKADGRFFSGALGWGEPKAETGRTRITAER
jgi:hypothetical protein